MKLILWFLRPYVKNVSNIYVLKFRSFRVTRHRSRLYQKEAPDNFSTKSLVWQLLNPPILGVQKFRGNATRALKIRLKSETDHEEQIDAENICSFFSKFHIMVNCNKLS